MPQNTDNKVTLRDVFGLQLEMRKQLSEMDMKIERIKIRVFIMAVMVSLSVSVGAKLAMQLFNLLPLP